MGRKRTADKEMEYEDAPSGYVKMYHYKEPFMEFWDEALNTGYGFQGVLAYDGETEKMQCHFCGKWFNYLPNHIKKEHNMKSADYKKRVGLRQSTALINETHRRKLIANGRERFKNLVNQKGKKRSQKTKDKIRKTFNENRAESQNEAGPAGTCEEQLIDQYLKLCKQLGRRATHDECGFRSTAKVRFGSWANFMARCGYEPIVNQYQITDKIRDKITEVNIIEFIKDFYIKFNVMPDSYTALKTNKKYASAYFGVQWQTLWERLKELKIKKLVKKVGSKNFDYDPTAFKGKGYTREDLTELLQNFEKNHGRLPASSDARRGLLPSVSTFHKYFGRWSTMLKEIFPEHYD